MTIDKQLEDEIRHVAARLSVLSDAPVSALEPRTSHGKSESREPTGPSWSLYDWFVREVEDTHPDDTERLEKLVRLGRIRYELRAVHAPRRTLLRSGTLDNPDMPREAKEAGVAWPAPEPVVGRSYGDDSEREIQAVETEDAAAQRVIDWYEGINALEVAVIENTTEVWVRKARKKHNRNPDDGRHLPPFLQWDDDERRRQISLLLARAKSRDEILGAKAVAKHFGVDKNTVKPYLEPRPVAA